MMYRLTLLKGLLIKLNPVLTKASPVLVMKVLEIMEQQYIQYISREDARNIDPSLIDYMTMSNGTLIKVEDQPCSGHICQNCGRQSQIMYQNIAFRGKNTSNKTQEEEQTEIQAEGQEEEQKDVLRGPDGKPLLSDILSGGDYLNNEQINQENNNQNEGEGVEGENQQGEGYYENNEQNQNEQYAQEEYENVEGSGYEGEYYDPNY